VVHRADILCEHSLWEGIRQRTAEEPCRRQVRGRAPASREGRPAQSSGRPRRSAAVALLIVGALYAVISCALTFGPRAFLLALVSVLLVHLLSVHQQGRHHLARWLGLGLVSLVTVAVVVARAINALATAGQPIR
jgi:hypothetical protein